MPLSPLTSRSEILCRQNKCDSVAPGRLVITCIVVSVLEEFRYADMLHKERLIRGQAHLIYEAKSSLFGQRKEYERVVSPGNKKAIP